MMLDNYLVSSPETGINRAVRITPFSSRSILAARETWDQLPHGDSKFHSGSAMTGRDTLGSELEQLLHRARTRTLTLTGVIGMSSRPESVQTGT